MSDRSSSRLNAVVVQLRGLLARCRSRFVSPAVLGTTLCSVVLLSGHPRHPQSDAWVAMLESIAVPSHSRDAGTAVSRRTRADTVVNAPGPELSIVSKSEGWLDSVVHTPRWSGTGWKGRVVVGEYITGTYCPRCQEHDWSFDGLRQRYPSTVFIGLAYHYGMNFPIADPAEDVIWRWWGWFTGKMTAVDAQGSGKMEATPCFPDSVYKRWYDKDFQYIDGQGMGFIDDPLNYRAQWFFDGMVEVIDRDLQTAPKAVLQVQARPQGGKLLTTVTVDSLAPLQREVYVRLVLVEDTVRIHPNIPKSHRIRKEHIMVVRLAAHTGIYTMGLPLHAPDGHGVVTYTFDVAHAQQQLRRNYAGADGGTMYRDVNKFKMRQELEFLQKWHDIFPDPRDWQMDPKRLHVVAYVQDQKTGEVLQAQMIPVTPGPHGERLTL